MENRNEEKITVKLTREELAEIASACAVSARNFAEIGGNTQDGEWQALWYRESAGYDQLHDKLREAERDYYKRKEEPDND